jgi:hypothetical protein
MLIEKRYFDDAKSEVEKIEKEIANERERMTEKERILEKEKREAEASEIIRKGNEKLEKIKKVPISKKFIDFTLLQNAALTMAEQMEMNIKIERTDDDLSGYIELAFENLWILESTPKECVDIWNELASKATRLYIATKDNMIIYQYYFDLFCEVVGGR